MTALPWIDALSPLIETILKEEGVFLHWCPNCRRLHSACAGPAVSDPNHYGVLICERHQAVRTLLCAACDQDARDAYYSDIARRQGDESRGG